MTDLASKLRIFFHGYTSPLSNWHIRSFTVKDIEFCCVEQFMMFCKAKLFGDEEVAEKIMATNIPAEHKKLGRSVAPFDQDIWVTKREGYVYQGMYAKFKQNKSLKAYIISTYPAELVEASKSDRIWGIGLGLDDPRIHNEKNWMGLNLCGKIAMAVRERIMYEEKQEDVPS